MEFSVWLRWTERHRLPDLTHPGIYVLAISAKPLHEKPFSWSRDISYVGMTKVDLAARLRQFDLTISGRRRMHGGADRVRHAYPDYEKLKLRLFVAVGPVFRQSSITLPEELRLMGEVAALEYVCMAKYAELFRRVPRFNNPESPKFSSLERASKGRPIDVETIQREPEG